MQGYRLLHTKKLIRKLIPFVVLYREPTLTATTPATEDIKIILPNPDALRRGCASWLKW